jgi:asparagine synthase (glutamine-hydrolysing)
VERVLGTEAAIERAVSSHLVADVPVGLFFSGGVDSSLIAALLKKKGVIPQAFCAAIADRPEDAAYAKRVSEELAIPYANFPFGNDEFESIYDEVVQNIDEPFADSSIFPTYYIAKKAREKVKVVLSGEGGDEYFFGYPRSRDLLSLRNAPLDPRAGVLDRLYVALPAFRGKNKLFERLFVFFKRPVSFYLLTMSPSKSLMTFAQWECGKKAISERAVSASDLDAALYLPNVLLRKADTATMLASLEARVPLLDVGVIAASRAARQEAVEAQDLKPVLKRLLAAYVSEDIVHRKKTGFGLRTKSYFDRSERVRNDFVVARAFLSEHGYLRMAVPDTETLLSRYPNVCWQLLFLYHALKNAGL